MRIANQGGATGIKTVDLKAREKYRSAEQGLAVIYKENLH